jgi:hypothetical protein
MDAVPDTEQTPDTRRAFIDSAICLAKQKVRALMYMVKDPNRAQRLGTTTAEDDITTIHQIIDAMRTGMEVAVDTDADPATVVQSLTWEEFGDLFPHEMEQLVAHIPDRKTKLPREKDIHDQIEGCFSVAQEGIVRAIKELRGLGGGQEGGSARPQSPDGTRVR